MSDDRCLMLLDGTVLLGLQYSAIYTTGAHAACAQHLVPNRKEQHKQERQGCQNLRDLRPFVHKAIAKHEFVLMSWLYIKVVIRGAI